MFHSVPRGLPGAEGWSGDELVGRRFLGELMEEASLSCGPQALCDWVKAGNWEGKEEERWPGQLQGSG